MLDRVATALVWIVIGLWCAVPVGLATGFLILK